MSYRDDLRLAEAQAIAIGDIVHRLDLTGLHRAGTEMVGPCPVCGGKDRFGINLQRGLFNCRRCDVGGDGIKLVEHALGLDFKGALAYLVGEFDVQITPEEADRRRRAAQRERDRQRKIADRKRQKAIGSAIEIWQSCKRSIERSPVAGYLAKRGINPDAFLGRYSRWPVALRYHPSLRYTVFEDGQWKVIHEGPAMVAGIQSPSNKLTGVHRTWIDLREPKGKARIVHDGTSMQAKKVLGSKKGGAIRLTSHRSDTMIMGEGLETTLTAMVSGQFPQAAFWCGVDLGNMAGHRLLGPGLKYAGEPDLSDTEAFVPPEWVERLIFIQDGDSEPRLTRAKLESGLRRAKHRNPRLRIQIWPAGQGTDLNDLLMDPDQ